GWAAFYTYVWPGVTQHPAGILNPPSVIDPIPVGEPISPPPEASVPVALAPMPPNATESDKSLFVKAVPTNWHIIGTEIRDSSNDVWIGRVERVDTDTRGEQSVVLKFEGRTPEQLTVPVSRIAWIGGSNNATPSRGVIPYSIAELAAEA